MSNYSNDQLSGITDFDSFIFKLNRIHTEESFKNANQEKFDSLTKREVEVLYLLANDLNNLQIGKELYISHSSVEQHRKNINKKLEANSSTQLFKFALAFNLV